MDYKQSLEEIKQQVAEAVGSATTEDELQGVFRTYLGRKGRIRPLKQSLNTLTDTSEQREMGQLIGEVEGFIHSLIGQKKTELGTTSGDSLDRIPFDISSYVSDERSFGAVHPLRQVEWMVEDIFMKMGFGVVHGPYIETERYNFEALNIPDEHPARDAWDTFWLHPRKRGYLLRTHTSPVQVRYMEEHTPPFRIIAPGAVFRYEATDASHHFQFHQIEGLMVADEMSIAHFRAVINTFFSEFFHYNARTRLRPGYFPFVEPGFEVDMLVPQTDKKGGARGRTEWLEMAGAGMVHPKVLESAGYDPRKVKGFAFGVGLDRLAMMKYHIDDVRVFLKNDIRVLEQFRSII